MRYSRKPTNSLGTILLEGSLHACRTRPVSLGHRICPTGGPSGRGGAPATGRRHPAQAGAVSGIRPHHPGVSGSALSRGGRPALPVLLPNQGLDRVDRRSMARRTIAEEAMSINAGSAERRIVPPVAKPRIGLLRRDLGERVRRQVSRPSTYHASGGADRNQVDLHPQARPGRGACMATARFRHSARGGETANHTASPTVTVTRFPNRRRARSIVAALVPCSGFNIRRTSLSATSRPRARPRCEIPDWRHAS